MRMKFKAEFIVEVEAEDDTEAHDFITGNFHGAKIPNMEVIEAVVLLGEGEEPQEVEA